MTSEASHSHPVLRQDGLVLRPSAEDDLDQLAQWFADPEIFRWWGGRPLSRDVVADKNTQPAAPRQVVPGSALTVPPGIPIN